MTYEEAKDHLICGRINCLTDMDKDEELRYVCRQALEKQMPKKPKWTYGKGMGIAECSVCGKGLHYYMKGCPECLNAIDWSDDEET